MLHHSNSRRHDRNRGSRIKTSLQVTLLTGVLIWLLYQVKHSYDKKNEYFKDAQDQLAHDDRSMFQGRKERVVGRYGDGKVEKVGENSDITSKSSEDKSGETVFEEDNADSHEDDAKNTERSEAEEGQANGAANKHNSESDSSGAESKSEVNSIGDDVPLNNHAQEESTGDTTGTVHEEGAQDDGSTNAYQTNASVNGADGEDSDKKEALDPHADSEFLSDDAKTGTNDKNANETLPDETGNIPSVHNENSKNDGSSNKGDAVSTTSDAYEHNNSETTVHIETGTEHEGATTSSEIASGDAEKGNSVESNSAEEKTGISSGGDEKGRANEVLDSKEGSLKEGNDATVVSTDQSANTVTENSQGASGAEAVNGSSEETKPVENQSDGATEMSSNGEKEDIKIETSTSTNDQHNEPQGGDGSSGSGGSNDGGPQTGKTETQ